MKTRSLLLLAVCLLALAVPVLADDWPQFRGPNRDNVSKEKGLLEQWPKKGPSLLWTYREAGIGFSGPAIVGNRLYTMGARKDTEYLIALDISGAAPKELWSAKVGPLFTFEGNVWGDGPRCTPTVDGDRVYALGGQGELICAETATGNVVWRKNLVKELDGEMMTHWGYSESPLVDGDHLICTPGGAKGTLAALDKKSGAVIWRSKELKDKAPYSSIIAADIGGVRQYIQLTYVDDSKGGAAAGVAAKDGKLLWYFPYFEGDSYAMAPTPIVRGDRVYLTVSLKGCRLLKISKNDKGQFQADDLYPEQNHKVMKNFHGGVVLVGDHIYGHCEKKGWVCQDFKTGKNVWLERNRLLCDSGALTCADGQLYLLSDEGTVALIKASPEKWIQSGQFELPEQSKLRGAGIATATDAHTWTHPVVANGRLYLRDQELLFCFDVRAKK
jgi:outer membrane protein assembly factor BamB